MKGHHWARVLAHVSGLVDDQHPHLELPRQGSDSVSQGRDAGAEGKDTTHGHQNLFIKIPLDRGWGHLDADDRDARPAELLSK